MREQIEITERIPLLDGNGNLTQPGYAKKLLPIYDKTKVKGGLDRLKEWDYYYIGNDHFGIALTVADNSYMGLDSFSFLSFDGKGSPEKSGIDLGRPWEITKSPMRAFPKGGTNLPETSNEGITEIYGRGYYLKFEVFPDAKAGSCKRRLRGHIANFRGKDDFDINIKLLDEPEESMVICTPFGKDGHFYYNQKINCMPASGRVTIGSDKYELDPETTMGLLDWGRGVWTYHNTWYWGSASGKVDGEDFGFNIGYGFGDTSAASENMLFYKGKAHKLSEVSFNIPMKPIDKAVQNPISFDGISDRLEEKFGRRDAMLDKLSKKLEGMDRSQLAMSIGNIMERKYGAETVAETEDYMEPWTFTSDDGRFEMDFMPIIDRASCTDVKLIKSDQHQVFGKYSGKAVLDDGTVIEIKDFMGFAEKVENKW